MGADINSLPNEVLHRIFHFYLQSETQVNFVNCISKVCQRWEKVSRNSSFFETLHTSLPLSSLVNLANAGALQRTKSLEFGSCNTDVKRHYKSIYTNTPQLRHLDLTGVCPNLNKVKEHAVLTEVEGLCPDLCGLVLYRPNELPVDWSSRVTILSSIFDQILHVRGPNFVKLDISNVILINMNKLFYNIAYNCPNLEELHAERLHAMGHRFPKFPIEIMARSCPKIKTLCLGFPLSFNLKFREGANLLPNLETFTHPNYRGSDEFTVSQFEMILSSSPNLKVLDVTGRISLWYEDINSLPAVGLQRIDLSHTRIVETAPTTTLNIFLKWSHSLTVIDLSNVKGDRINELFLPTNLPTGLPNLEDLIVKNTAFEEDTVVTVTDQCPRLSYLNLEECRSLRRGTRNIYESRSAIEELCWKFEMDTDMDCS